MRQLVWLPHFFRISILLILTLAIVSCQSTSQQPVEEVTPTPIPTQPAPVNPVYTVQRGDVISKIEFTGRISPIVEQELFFQTDGRIRRVLVERNQEVKKGQLLADLEIDDLERQLAITELNIRRNEIQLEVAELELEYTKAQYPSKDQKHQVELAERQLELQKIALEEASLNLEDLKASIAAAQIIAPFDGVLLFINMSKGAAVTGYKPLVTIADISSLEVSADVSTENLQKLQEGMEVTAAFYSKPGEVYTGAIRRLPYPYGGGTDNADLIEDDTSTRVSLNIPPDKAEFELGDLIRITVVIEKSENTLWLPPQAIRNFEGRKFVLVQEGDVQRRMDVKTGLSSEDRVEITEGLDENQVVIGP